MEGRAGVRERDGERKAGSLYHTPNLNLFFMKVSDYPCIVNLDWSIVCIYNVAYLKAQLYSSRGKGLQIGWQECGLNLK